MSLRCYTDRSCRCSGGQGSPPDPGKPFPGQTLGSRKRMGRTRLSHLRRCFKTQPRTQAFCQSHSLAAPFCRGGFPLLGGLGRQDQDIPSVPVPGSQGGRSIRGLGRLGRLLTSWWKSSGQELHILRAQRLPREHLLLPRPYTSCSTSH